jgi:hypothetical protein
MARLTTLTRWATRLAALVLTALAVLGWAVFIDGGYWLPTLLTGLTLGVALALMAWIHPSRQIRTRRFWRLQVMLVLSGLGLLPSLVAYMGLAADQPTLFTWVTVLLVTQAILAIVRGVLRLRATLAEFPSVELTLPSGDEEEPSGAQVESRPAASDGTPEHITTA